MTATKEADGEALDLAEAAIHAATAVILRSGHHAGLNAARIADLVASMPAVPHEAPLLRLPLRFDRISEEVNFFCLVHLLKFGAFFRDHLPVRDGHAPSAYEHALRGVLSLFLTGKLDGNRLTNLSIVDIESAFSLPLSREERLDNMPAYINVDVPTKQLSSDILSILHQTGRLLNTHRVDSLGEYVLEFVLAHAGGECLPAPELVLRLASTFPAFDDKPFYSKASALVSCLYLTFKDRIPEINFSHMSKLCPSSDIDLVDFFYDRGVIEIKDPSTPVAVELLRFAAVLAQRQVQSQLTSSRHLPLPGYEIDAILRDLHSADESAAARGDRISRPYWIPNSYFF